MGKNVVVIGAQWGDEGKGKIIDLLTEKTSNVVRFQGGHNAGHTIVVKDEKTILHIIPSGVLHNNIECLIGNGVVLSITALLKEIATLKKNNIDILSRLAISPSCILILPYHIAIDKAHEEMLGKNAIGTTCNGIGPAYEDKVARRGLRVGDLLHSEYFANKLEEVANYHNFILNNYYKAKTIDYKKVLDEIMDQAKIIKNNITDVTNKIYQKIENNENILFEGAQGALLDIDQGTYPYVTSSNTISGGVNTGSGVGIANIDYVLSIVKTYTTRVGAGPFPTELVYDVASDKGDSIGKELGIKGCEFGATTGRQRRCGWLDIVALNHSFRINSVTGICLTKLDVLDNLNTIKICVAYEINGKITKTMPYSIQDFNKIKPIYIDIEGWKTSTIGINSFDLLPTKAKKYIEKISDLTNLPIDIISTGPERNQTIIINHPFN